jgi:hypothetical protein
MIAKKKIIGLIDRDYEVRRYLLDQAMKGKLSLLTPEVKKEIIKEARHRAHQEVFDKLDKSIKTTTETRWGRTFKHDRMDLYEYEELKKKLGIKHKVR